MYSFDAEYDEEGSALAERTFVARSVRQLRPWSTFGPPVVLSVIVFAGLALEAPGWFLLSLGAILALSVLLPLYMLYERPRAAGSLARGHPVRNISLSVESITVCFAKSSAVVAWSRVRHVWSAPGYTLLVLGRFVCVSIPDRSLPAGAPEFIRRAVKNVH
jgi:hypothetical protein